MNTSEIVNKQREYFLSNETKDLKFRKKQLRMLSNTATI